MSKRNKSIDKTVLQGFVKQAISHNKYLEEKEMWEQRTRLYRKSRGRSKARFRSRSRSRSRSLSQENQTKSKSSKKSNKQEEFKIKDKNGVTSDDEIDEDLKAVLALYRSAKEKSLEKWDHSGYQSLYPNVSDDIHEKIGSTLRSKSPNGTAQKSISINSAEKWDHAGYDSLFSSGKNECDSTSIKSSRSCNETKPKESRVSRKKKKSKSDSKKKKSSSKKRRDPIASIK